MSFRMLKIRHVIFSALFVPSSRAFSRRDPGWCPRLTGVPPGINLPLVFKRRVDESSQCHVSMQLKRLHQHHVISVNEPYHCFLMRDVRECLDILAAPLKILQLRAFDRHHAQNHPLHLFNLFCFIQLGTHSINLRPTFICHFTTLLTAPFG
jgi:hypothetical protein